MARIRTLICPSCTGQFNYMQHPSTEPDNPRFCPLCGYDTEQQIEEIAIPLRFNRAITAPHIAKSIGKAGDATYRDMEASAEARIDAAAEMTGLDRADFNDMKITDLKDNLRQGDIAAKEPEKNEVSTMVESKPGLFGFQGPEAAQGFAAAAHTGPGAYAGAKARMNANDHFARMGGSRIAAEEKGRF